MGQYLTPGARARKAKRDLEYAKTPERRKKRQKTRLLEEKLRRMVKT